MQVTRQPILASIWLFVHVVYGLAQHVVILWMWIWKACEKLLNQSAMQPRDEHGVLVVQKRVKQLAKVPGHFAVLLGDNDVSLGDMANMVVWCVSAGISCVSFYDYNGTSKAVDKQLCSALAKMGKVGSRCLNKIIWGNKDLPNYIPAKQRNGTNGHNTSAQRLHVNLFSLSDSKASLVDVAKSLLTTSTTSDIDVKLVGSVLQKSLNIPEVDLAVCCGRTFCTYGFLPWHTRLTEFSQLPNHRKLEVSYFISLLDAYSKCQQRFGK